MLRNLLTKRESGLDVKMLCLSGSKKITRSAMRNRLSLKSIRTSCLLRNGAPNTKYSRFPCSTLNRSLKVHPGNCSSFSVSELYLCMFFPMVTSSFVNVALMKLYTAPVFCSDTSNEIGDNW